MVGLLLLGAAFAVGNLWLAAARTTIPLALDGRVARKDRHLEKTPGVDDVCFLTLEGGTRMQVDIPIYEAVLRGRTVRKEAWSARLVVDGTTVDLAWSRDVRGMAWTMSGAMAVAILLGAWAMRRSDRGAVVGGPDHHA